VTAGLPAASLIRTAFVVPRSVEGLSRRSSHLSVEDRKKNPPRDRLKKLKIMPWLELSLRPSYFENQSGNDAQIEADLHLFATSICRSTGERYVT